MAGSWYYARVEVVDRIMAASQERRVGRGVLGDCCEVLHLIVQVDEARNTGTGAAEETTGCGDGYQHARNNRSGTG